MIETREDDRTVRLAERLAFSGSFRALFDEGMGLVDEAAVYLDGRGREDARELPKATSTLYAAESMRLTTRLMQIASWLLLQRAANQGDMTRAQVEAEKVKVRLDGLGSASGSDTFAALPETFRSLVNRALTLERRIATLDREIYGETRDLEAETTNPVGEQINLLRMAFDR